MEKYSVIGSGTMGQSIALAVLMVGKPVKVWCLNEEEKQKALRDLKEKMNRLAIYNIFCQEKDLLLTTDLEEVVKDATFIIEAVPEILSLKQEWYQKLDTMCDKKVILASNTSGYCASEIAVHMAFPERMVVTHFWNPAHLVPLVEVVPSKKTTEATTERAMAAMSAIGKKPIHVKKEVNGFIGNRLQYALLREAEYLLQQGVATAEEIDLAVTSSIGARYLVTGPFLSADMGGLDVFHSISSYLYPQLSKQEQSSDEMKRHIEQGQFGVKTGQGFYQWDESFQKEMNEKREQELIRLRKKHT